MGVRQSIQDELQPPSRGSLQFSDRGVEECHLTRAERDGEGGQGGGAVTGFNETSGTHFPPMHLAAT
jgi:hypothetical protein